MKERYVAYYMKKHPHATQATAIHRYEFLRKLHSGYYDQPEDLDDFRLDYSGRF